LPEQSAAPPQERQRAFRELAILKPGANPLWFEFAAGGPRLISSPEDASLTDFTPWPYSPHSVGVLPYKNGLAMAVNREGFFIFLPDDSAGAPGDFSVGMYSQASPAWGVLSASSNLFTINGAPSAFVYRDNFFADAQGQKPPWQIYSLDENSVSLRGQSAAAFNSAGDSFEATALLNAGGAWYFSLEEIGKKEGAIRYYRSQSLDSPGAEISMGAFHEAFPEPSAPDTKGLPALPEGFVWTGSFRADRLLLGTWEEQEDAAIGAAGFAVLLAGQGN
jgi:hypothetical protein